MTTAKEFTLAELNIATGAQAWAADREVLATGIGLVAAPGGWSGQAYLRPRHHGDGRRGLPSKGLNPARTTWRLLVEAFRLDALQSFLRQSVKWLPLFHCYAGSGRSLRPGQHFRSRTRFPEAESGDSGRLRIPWKLDLPQELDGPAQSL